MWRPLISLRSPAAQRINHLVHSKRLKNFAKKANVSEVYLWYIRCFIETPEQYQFVLHLTRQYSQNRRTGLKEVKFNLSPEVDEILRYSVDNISRTVRNIYREKRHEY